MEMRKKPFSKFFHSFMLLVMFVASFLPLLSTSNKVKAAEVASSDYTLSTRFLINNNTVKNKAEYGEGKFYFEPTYTFADSATLKNGDTLSYTVPSTFALEASPETSITSANGTEVAKLTVNPANNVATVTITNADYFVQNPDDKRITALFTATWASSIPLNVEQNFTVPGAGEYSLTRIVPDNDPTGYTKWGVQDKADPTLVNWRVRINRYAEDNVTNAVIKDTIPDNQTLIGNITGYYFDSWSVTGKLTGQKSFNQSIVTEKTDNSFTITPDGQGLQGRGIFLIYQTRITGPVDMEEKKVYNSGLVTSNEGNHPFEGFAPLTVTDGISAATKEVDVALAVNKSLDGRTLKDGEFSFELVDTASNQGLQIKTNKADGSVTFDTIKLTKLGTFTYKIRELDSNQTGVTNDANNEITATVTVTSINGKRSASVSYDRTSFTNTYQPLPAKAQPTVKTNLTGRELKADEFKFQLKDGKNLLQEKTNDANGNVTFDELTFDKTGTYTYTISEVDNEDPGVTSDKKEVKVTVTVVDNNGQLEATVTYDNDPSATFNNQYTAQATSAKIEAKTTLTGRDLKDGEFSFIATDPAGNTLTAKNKADGSIEFTTPAFTQAGTYTYTISQVKGDEKGMTYDESSHTVTITVTDNGQGQLVASLDQVPSFENHYKEEQDVVSDVKDPNRQVDPQTDPAAKGLAQGRKVILPRTGEETSWLMILLGLCFLSLLVLGYRFKKAY